MITEQHTKEGLGISFIYAVSHAAGFNLATSLHDYGFDGTFKEVKVRHNRYVESGFNLDFQLKSSEDVEYDDKNDLLIYDLEAKTYMDLIDNEIGTPRILILYVMPKDQSEWLCVNCNTTTLKKCAWWMSLKGLPPSDNKDSKRIKIPYNQILTVETLQELMNMVKRGELL